MPADPTPAPKRYCPCNLHCHTESESPCSMDCYAHHGEVIGGEWPKPDPEIVQQSHSTPWPGPCTSIEVGVSGDPTPAERREWATSLLHRLAVMAGDHHAFISKAQADDLAAAVRDLADENERLRLWKAEAIAVLGQWDEVHKALGSPGLLGQSIAVASREEVLALKEALDG